MRVARSSSFTQCASCLRAQRRLPPTTKPITRPIISPRRTFSSSPRRRNEKPSNGTAANGADNKEDGAMSRRLSEMTDEALLQGGRSARKSLMQEAGFSEDLKQELEEKIKASSFKSDNAGAFSLLDMPVCPLTNKDGGYDQMANAVRSPAQEKAPATMPFQHRGEGPKPSKTPRLECSTTPKSPCVFLIRSPVLLFPST